MFCRCPTNIQQPPHGAKKKADVIEPKRRSITSAYSLTSPLGIAELLFIQSSDQRHLVPGEEAAHLSGLFVERSIVRRIRRKAMSSAAHLSIDFGRHRRDVLWWWFALLHGTLQSCSRIRTISKYVSKCNRSKISRTYGRNPLRTNVHPQTCSALFNPTSEASHELFMISNLDKSNVTRSGMSRRLRTPTTRLISHDSGAGPGSASSVTPPMDTCRRHHSWK